MVEREIKADLDQRQRRQRHPDGDDRETNISVGGYRGGAGFSQ
jgi:hypothetical protein